MSFSPGKDNVALEKSTYLFSLTDDLKQHLSFEKQLEIIENSVKFLDTYDDLIQLEEELLQYLLPYARNCIKNVFEENTNIFEDNEINLTLLKRIVENLQVVESILNICLILLESVHQFGNCDICSIESISSEFVESIFIVFEHCKIRQDEYTSKAESKNAMMSLFKKCQEIHQKYLKWLVQFMEITFINEDSITLLKKVLNSLCKVGRVLSDMNKNSMADNWKGYISLVVKHTELMIDNLCDMSEPFELIIAEMDKLLQKVSDDQEFRILNFLTKVLLKLFDTFSRLLDNYYGKVLKFFSTLYSYTPKYFEYRNFPPEYVTNIDGLFQLTLPFLTQIIQEKSFFMALYSEECDIPTIGMMNFTNVLLEYILDTLSKDDHAKEEFNRDSLLSLAFTCVSCSFIDFYLSPYLYDSLLIKITTIILLRLEGTNNFYHIEELLLKNVMQENFWQALLSIDIWCLLCNTSMSYTEDVLMQLLATVSSLKKGYFTNRPEFIYISILINRICLLLPLNRIDNIFCNKNLTLNSENLQMLPFENTPYFHNILYKVTDSIFRRELLEDSTQKDFIDLVEDIKVLSCVDAQNFEPNLDRLSIVLDFWNIDFSKNIVSNSFFKYMLQNVSKITTMLKDAFNASTILKILEQINQLPKELNFKIITLDVFTSLSTSSSYNFTQQSIAIVSYISDLFQLYLQDENLVIQIIAMQEFEKFARNTGHVSIVKCILENLKFSNITQFLQKKCNHDNLDYLKTLEIIKFEHKCINWVECSLVNLNIEDYLPYPQLNDNLGQQNKKFKSELKHKNIDNQIEICNYNNSGEFGIDSLINSIKTDMKNLAKAAKKENLTNKNISDINYIVNQLRSVCQK